MSERPEGEIWRFGSASEYIARTRKPPPPLIVSVAITGGVQGKEANPALPETPEEQAEEARRAYEAGASIVHIHARRADDPSRMDPSPERYLEINRLVREACPDIVINNTAFADTLFDDPEAVARADWGVVDAVPEILAIDCGPQAYRFTAPARGGRPEIEVDTAYLTTYGETEEAARLCREREIKPELEVFDSGQLWIVDNLIAQGLVDAPYWIQFVMGCQTCTRATPHDLLHLLEHLPDDALFSVIGVGRFQTPLATLAILLGGHVRVGLEDNLYYRRQELASSNAQQVERVVRLADELERPVATPAEARRMLGLPAEPRQYQ